MPRIQVNLDAVQENRLVDPGWYHVRVEKGEVRQNRDGSGQHINWELRIVEGEAEGRRLFFNTGLSEKGLPILKRFLMAAGFQWDPDGFDIEDVLGSELWVRVEHREFDGEPRADVRGFRSL